MFSVAQQTTLCRALGLATLLSPPFCAHGAWSAKTFGPDVFGQTTVVAESGGEDESLVVQCDDQGKLFIAFIFTKKKFDEVQTLPADLLIQVDNGTPIHLGAETRSWNDDYAGVVAEGRTSASISGLKAIGGARTSLNAGVVVGDHRESATFSSAGSTEAIEEAFRGCKLGAETRK